MDTKKFQSPTDNPKVLILCGDIVLLFFIIFSHWGSFRDNLAVLAEAFQVNTGLAPAVSEAFTLTWDPVTQDTQNNPETVSGYRLYWGTASQMYDHSRDVGNVTSYTFPSGDLVSGVRYYFAVTAIDTTNNESTTSLELNPFPLANAGSDRSVLTGTWNTLYGSAKDADGTIQSYAWSVPSSSHCSLQNQQSPTVSIACPNAGTYTVTLTVTDNNQLTNADSMILYVTSTSGGGGGEKKLR